MNAHPRALRIARSTGPIRRRPWRATPQPVQRPLLIYHTRNPLAMRIAHASRLVPAVRRLSPPAQTFELNYPCQLTLDMS